VISWPASLNGKSGEPHLALIFNELISESPIKLPKRYPGSKMTWDSELSAAQVALGI
jgi:hypothetical protein